MHSEANASPRQPSVSYVVGSGDEPEAAALSFGSRQCALNSASHDLDDARRRLASQDVEEVTGDACDIWPYRRKRHLRRAVIFRYAVSH